MKEDLESIISYAEKENKHAVIMLAKQLIRNLDKVPEELRCIDEEFGACVREYRKKHAITTVDLSDRVGISRETLRRVEGGGGCSLDIAFKLCKCIGLPMHELFEQKKYPKDAENYIKSFVDSFDIIIEQLNEGQLEAPWVAVRPDGQSQQMHWNTSQVQSLVDHITTQMIAKFTERFGNRENYIYHENQHLLVTIGDLEAQIKELKEKKNDV